MMNYINKLALLIIFFLTPIKVFSLPLSDIAELEKIKCSTRHYLEPFHGIYLANQPLLTNLFKYPNNNDKRDPKSDPVERSIQTSFNIPPESHDPIFFQINPLAKNFAKFLPPSAIGQVLNILTKYSKYRLTDDLDKIKESLTTEIKEVLKNNEEYKHHIREGEANADVYEKANIALKRTCGLLKEKFTTINRELTNLNAKSNSDNTCNSKGIIDCKNKIEELKVQIDKLNEQITNNSCERDKHKPEEKYLNAFVSTLVEAWIFDNTNKSSFSPNFLEQVLVAIAWHNSESKKEFIGLYKELRQYCQINPTLQIEKKYTFEDFKTTKDKISQLQPLEKAKFLVQNPFSALLISPAGEALLSSTAVHQISYRQAKYNTFTFPDCMESSILNFLSIIAKLNRPTFDPTLLEIPGYQLNQNVKDFFNKFKTPESLMSHDAHNAWAKIVSGIPGIKYVHSEDQYEMDTTTDNLIQILEYLLLGKSPQNTNENVSPNRSERFNFILSKLSRENLTLDWNIDLPEGSLVTKDQKLNSTHPDENLNLSFFLNEVHKFDWSLDPEHSEIELVNTNQDIVTPDVINNLINFVKNNSLDSEIAKHIITLFIDPEETVNVVNFKNSIKSLNSRPSLPLRYYLPLAQTDTRVDLIKDLLELNPIFYKTRIEHLIKSLYRSPEIHADLLPILVQPPYSAQLTSHVPEIINYPRSPADNLDVLESIVKLKNFSLFLDVLKQLPAELPESLTDEALSLLKNILSTENFEHTPKMAALFIEKLSLKQLFDFEVKHNPYNHIDNSPFGIALKFGHLEIAKLIITKILNKSSEILPEELKGLRERLINIALKMSDPMIIKWMVDMHFINTNMAPSPTNIENALKTAKNKVGQTYFQAFHYLRDFSHLLDFTNSDSRNNWNVLHLLALNNDNDEITQIELLKEFMTSNQNFKNKIRSYMFQIDTMMKNPIYYASERNKGKLISYLYELANIDLANNIEALEQLLNIAFYVKSKTVLQMLESKNLLPEITPNMVFHAISVNLVNNLEKDLFYKFLLDHISLKTIEPHQEKDSKGETILQSLIKNQQSNEIIIHWINKFTSTDELTDQLIRLLDNSSPCVFDYLTANPNNGRAPILDLIAEKITDNQIFKRNYIGWSFLDYAIYRQNKKLTQAFLNKLNKEKLNELIQPEQGKTLWQQEIWKDSSKPSAWEETWMYQMIKATLEKKSATNP